MLSPQDGEKEPTPPPHLPTEKSGLPLLLKLVVFLAVIALAVFAGVIIAQLLENREGPEKTQLSQPGLPEEKPVSILPDEPDGVTVIAKQPDAETPTDTGPLAPIAQGADAANGFAVDLGASDSYLELSRKFAELVTVNGEGNFQRLEPRAVLRETITGLEARLLIGPFETRQQAEEACTVLILPDETPCSVDLFQGDLIPRQ